MNKPYPVSVATEDHIRVGLTIQLVAAATGVPGDRMRAKARLRNGECRARRMAIYLAHVALGWPIERVAHAFGLNRATTAAACRWVEDERDHPSVDAMLNRLERCLCDVVKAPLCEVRG